MRISSSPAVEIPRTIERDVEVYSLSKRNCKLNVRVKIDEELERSILSVLDTGVGPSSISKDAAIYLAADIRTDPGPSLRYHDANGRPLQCVGTTTLAVRLGTYTCRLTLIVVERLSTYLILGCDFIDNHVESVKPRLQKVMMKKDREFESNGGSPPSYAKRLECEIRIAHKAVIPPSSEMVISVRCYDWGTFYMQPRSESHEKQRVWLTNGVIKIQQDVPFTVILSNFSSVPQRLHKNQIVGYAVPLDEEGIFPIQNLDLKYPHKQKEDNILHPLNEDDQSLTDVDLNHLPTSVARKVKQMLRKHSKMWSRHLGELNAPPHRINLEADSRPVHAHPYRAGPQARIIEQEEVRRMSDMGVIEPCKSEWASPVVMVPNPDGSARFCVDYRRLNVLTIKDTYPLPRMDEGLDSLGEAKYFTTLDCNSGYRQIPIAEEDRNKTTFTCHARTYRFLRMPFGLCNAPPTFQRTVDILLSGYRWKTCLVYLDDVIIFSKSIEEHLRHVDEVLEILRQAGMSLRLRKCHFFTNSVNYLGHVIRPGTLEVSEKNIVAIRAATPPKNQTQPRYFLGLCNVYRLFVPGFARIARPLTELTKKETSFQLPDFNEEQLIAFEDLKSRLISTTVLRLPRTGLPFYIDTDACEYQIGCTLMQEDSQGARHPAGYWSRTLSSAERNYSAAERECRAAVWAVTTLRPYLERTRFIVHTDHKALRWLLNLTDGDTTGSLARWRLRLSEYDFEV